MLDLTDIYTYINPIFKSENLAVHMKIGALAIALSVLIAVYVQKLVSLVRINIGDHFIHLCLAIIAACFSLITPTFGWNTMGSTPREIFALLQPLRIFSIVFAADFNVLQHRVVQVLLLNTIGLCTFVFVFGVAMSCSIHGTIHWGFVLCYGMAMSSSDYSTNLKILKRLAMPSATLAVILSEGITTFANSLIAVDIYLGAVDRTVVSFFQVVFIYVRMAAEAVLVGTIVGKLCTRIMNPFMHNTEMLIISWVFIAHVMYQICEGYLHCSGTLAVLVYAILMNAEKSRVPASCFQKMRQIVSNWHYIVRVYAYQYTFRSCVTIFVQFFDIQTVFLSLGAFMFRILARASAVALLYPVLFRRSKKNGYPIMILIFSRRDVFEMNKVRILYHHPPTHVIMQQAHDVAFLTIFWEIVMDHTVVRSFFNHFGTNVVSVARKSSIAGSFGLLDVTRKSYLHIFQMDKVYGDANWKMIRIATDLWDAKAWDEATVKKQNYVLRTCLDCQAQTMSYLSPYEKAERLKVLRALILRTQRVSFNRQNERGLISKSDLKALSAAMNMTELTKSIHIDIPELSILYSRSTLQNLKQLLENISRDNVQTSPRRSFAFASRMYRLTRFVEHCGYELFVFFFILLDFAISYANFFLTCHQQLIFLIPYSVYFVDAVIRVHIYAHCENRRYMRDFWIRFDLVMLLVNSVELLLIISGAHCERLNIYGYVVFLLLLRVGQLRLLRIIRLLYRLRRQVLVFCDRWIERRVATGYSRAISVLFSYHEALHVLPTFEENLELRREMENEIVKEKAIILAQLNNIQYKFTRVAVLAKTKRIINTSIATMRETIDALKVMGFTDEEESLNLVSRVESLRMPLLKLSHVEISSPSQILRWLPFFESVKDFESLEKAALEMVFFPGELIVRKGRHSDGVYIVIDGLASMKLVIDPMMRGRVRQYGALPVKDYLYDLDYYLTNEHYVINGSSIGLMSYLTRRPCDYDVRAVAKTRVFFLSAATLNAAIEVNNNPIDGLQCKLWKYVAVNLALSIMWRVPLYKNLGAEETYYYVEKSFVPDLSGKTTLYLSDEVEDVILIEGRFRDTVSRKLYVAPCYVPRSVRKLQLIRKHKISIEPQILIIPLKPELNSKIFENFDCLKRIPTFGTLRVLSRQSIRHDSGFKHLNFSKKIDRPSIHEESFSRLRYASALNLAASFISNKEKDSQTQRSSSTLNKKRSQL